MISLIAAVQYEIPVTCQSLENALGAAAERSRRVWEARRPCALYPLVVCTYPTLWAKAAAGDKVRGEDGAGALGPLGRRVGVRLRTRDSCGERAGANPKRSSTLTVLSSRQAGLSCVLAGACAASPSPSSSPASS